MMKPLLIVPPSPTRWTTLGDLLRDADPLALSDLRTRLADGVKGARDAFAVLPESSHLLACACIRRRHDIGVLGQLYTRPDHRKQGRARAMLQTLLSWFDMTGGKRLYLSCEPDVAEYLFQNFGFRVLRRHAADGRKRLTMLRTPAHVADSPFEKLSGGAGIREVKRADWPLLVSLLQHVSGADPRVSLDESAVAAEDTALELINQAESGACRLIAATCKDRIVGVGSIATQPGSRRTYAMLLPHDRPPEGLRSAVLEFARQRGFEQVDFPMETLASPAGESPRGEEQRPENS